MARLLFIAICVSVGIIGTLADESKWSQKDLFSGKVSRIDSISELFELRKFDRSVDLKPIYLVMNVHDYIKQKLPCRSLMGEELNSLELKGPKMPKALEKFMRTLTLELSAVCKLNALKYTTILDNKLEKELLSTIEKFEKAGAFILDDNVALKNTDIITLYSVLARHLSWGAGYRRSSSPLLDEFEVYCQQHYRTVDTLMFTLFEYNAGRRYEYSINGKLLAKHKDEINSSKSLKRWLNVALVCNSLFSRTKYQPSTEKLADIVHKDPTFTQNELPDKLLIDQDTEVEELQRLGELSWLEADKWAVDYYNLLSKIPATQREEIDNRLFTQEYLKLVEQKLAQLSRKP